MSGDIGEIKKLIARGVPINFRCPDQNHTVFIGWETGLHVASRYGQVDTVKFLIMRNARLNMTNRFLNTPLIEAASYGKMEIVRLLMNAKADASLMGGKERTAAGWAKANGHHGIASYITNRIARAKRLARGPKTELYHQTDEKSADAIIRSQKFFRGSDGYSGGGIYFADSPQATNRKAHSKGVILSATVALGKIQTQKGSFPNTFTDLIKQGFDSVRATGLRSGVEYVVFNWDQCSNIKFLKYA